MTLTGPVWPPLDQCFFCKLLLNGASNDTEIGCSGLVWAGAKKYKFSFLLCAGPLRCHAYYSLNITCLGNDYEHGYQQNYVQDVGSTHPKHHLHYQDNDQMIRDKKEEQAQSKDIKNLHTERSVALDQRLGPKPVPYVPPSPGMLIPLNGWRAWQRICT